MLGLWASSYFPELNSFQFKYRDAGLSRLTELLSLIFLWLLQSFGT